MPHLLRVRSILESTNKRDRLIRRVDALDNFQENQDVNVVFDHAYSIVDSVCKTILTDHNSEIENHQDLPKTFKQTIKSFWFDDEWDDESIKKIVRWLVQSVQGLCELRNDNWPLSHWKDMKIVTKDEITLLTTIKAVDVIIGFLMSVDRSNNSQTKYLKYEDNREFNDRYDAIYWPVKIWIYDGFSPSELLFTADIDAYHEQLLQYSSENNL
jgi:hypothetical protein